MVNMLKPTEVYAVKTFKMVNFQLCEFHLNFKRATSFKGGQSSVTSPWKQKEVDKRQKGLSTTSKPKCSLTRAEQVPEECHHVHLQAESDPWGSTKWVEHLIINADLLKYIQIQT